ncbi:hypothetical protein HYPSUDRAFT_200969 [Hypholoma sublateritium FD-334 SS-4]|uniref:Uncharacterized protein n=1 Tax=Hypholoma sublateritium (strain FD-334 SS-4) TaxID=945553 RepID=A0A0D2NYM3_HYPSF|nr:hypothetical protein HYPSUDRAFT_200969 [Hypholoma sublateritium FD-334 SS-4]
MTPARPLLLVQTAIAEGHLRPKTRLEAPAHHLHAFLFVPMPTPAPAKQKRAPIPLNSTHPVYRNTVPAGVFKALISSNEKRT